MSVNNIPPQSPNLLPEIPDFSFIESVNRRGRSKNLASVKQVASGMAEVAYSMGMTNNASNFLDEMSEIIVEAWEEMDEIQKKKKRKNK